MRGHVERAARHGGAPLLFTTHDRNSSSTERALWRLEAVRWERGEQDSRLVEFGDRYFEEAGTGRTRRSSIQVVELHERDGILSCNRDLPTEVRLR